jgi:hypothetical protein
MVNKHYSLVQGAVDACFFFFMSEERRSVLRETE